MELNTLKKVSDAQLTEAAFDMGRKLAMHVQKFSLDDKERIDSLQELIKFRILRFNQVTPCSWHWNNKLSKPILPVSNQVPHQRQHPEHRS